MRRSPTDVTSREPAARVFHVCVVCSGNICRSPIVEKMLRAAVEQAGLADRVRVTSGGTGSWHVGQQADARARKALLGAGFPDDHCATQVSARSLADVDLVLAADRGHVQQLRRWLADPDRVRLLRTFDQDADHHEIPDPYDGPDSGFDDVIEMVAAAVPGILDEIRKRLR